MEDTSATGSDGSNPWGSVVIIWILTSDFLFQSDRGTVCPWNFVRSEDDGGTGNDILLERYAFVSSYTLIVAAFIGALISTGFILLLSRKMKHMATLLVGGIMIGYICSAITDFVVTFAEDSDIVNLHGWSQGSFSGMNWSNVQVAVIVIGVTTVLTFSCLSQSVLISWEKLMRRAWE